jgi:hypothetical protein
MAKARRTISEDEVDRAFSDARIKELAKLAKLPKDADLEKFRKNIRQDARIYCRAARVPSDNELHKEIKALHHAADKNLFEKVAGLIENLSPRALSELGGRWEQRHHGIRFPEPSDLITADHREAACVKIASLCRMGGKYIEGRMRPSGKHSWTWQWLYYAPGLSRNFPKRSAEYQFVMHLAITWYEMTGKSAPRFTRQGSPGPFARMVHKCIKLCEGPAANAINLVNEHGRRRGD